MKRLLAAVAAVALLAALVTVTTGAGDSSSSGYRVDAVFDNVGFLVPGQDVKIAGAKVGSVTSVGLTKQRKGLVQMQIDPGFAPFRGGADCVVQPQSLIGERFIQCYPGKASEPPLSNGPGGAPTVPVTATHSPVDLDLVLLAFKAPEPQRLALLLSSLGVGTAGRGEDLNTIIRRANPALQQTANVLDTVNSNRTQLRSLIKNADTVVGELSRRNAQIRSFVKSAGDLSQTTADRRRQLQATLRDLPGVLGQLPGYLSSVQTTLDVASPDLDALRTSAQPVNALLTQADKLTTDTRPAVRELRTTARKARAILAPTRPVLNRLNRFTKSALPAARLINQLGDSSRDSGVLEGLQSFVYYATAVLARYDGTSHLLGAYPVVNGTCSLYATVPVPSCDSHFDSFKGGSKARAKERHKPAPSRPSSQHAAEKSTAAAPPPAAGGTPPAPPAAAKQPQGILPSLLDSVGGLLKPKKQQGRAPAPSAPTGPKALSDLLGYLLG